MSHPIPTEEYMTYSDAKLIIDQCLDLVCASDENKFNPNGCIWDRSEIDKAWRMILGEGDY